MRASLLLCLMSLLASDVARGQIFVAGGTKVAEYNLDGSAINTSLITGLNSATYLAISGSNLFVTSTNGGTVGKYTTAGGRSIALCIYDGPISHDIAFGPLMETSDAFDVCPEVV